MSKSNQIRELIESGGKYSILSEFNEGANGYAFKAWHRHLEFEVFLKIIDADPEVESTFAEPKALLDASANGDCENLVKLIDAEHLTSDYVMMAMEFIEGGSLNPVIVGENTGQHDAIQLAMGVLVGLGRLHSAQFVHRDVKPGNLLLKLTGTTKIIKVGDFGSVRQIQDDSGQVSASRHSALYRPKEAWGDNGWFTFTSDLYQAGVCLYELVNGPLPYSLQDYLDTTALRALKTQGLTYAQLNDFEKSQAVDGCLERRIQKGKLLEMRSPRPYLSKKLASIIRKATAVEAVDRYQTAFEFRNALQALSLPNWRKDGDGYSAEAWRDWDWKVLPSPTGSGINWDMTRSRCGANKFRSFRKGILDVGTATKMVDDFE